MKTLIVVLFFLLAAPSLAAELIIEFSYTPSHPEYAAAAYRVRANGNEVCTTSAPETSSPGELQCDASALAPGVYPFTLSALYKNGAESGRSEPYALEILPPSTVPSIIIIKFR